MRIPFVLLLGVLGALACGCSSAPASSSDTAASSDSNFTEARPDASADDVPPYTDADTPFAYGARVRVAYGGGAPIESQTTASYSPSPDRPMPWALGIGRTPAGGAVFAYFGAASAKTPAVGTYACADGDATIFEGFWDAQGNALPSHAAQTCSFVIDRIVPGPSADYVRAFGRFSAAAAPPDGLSTDLKGAFLADFPVGH